MPVVRFLPGHGLPVVAVLIHKAMLLFSSAPVGTNQPLEPAQLNVGFIESAFFGIHRLDAEAAFKTFTRTIGRNMGYDISVTVSTFESAR
ncbi:hypothetical protein [Desulfonatronum sp. SC1]|uniref:hypothetical protein n=1 Tax=Desulfonatronum sp. SC1 TaxID=2109626 RepID=UPI0011B2911D|nr:hypothetical protein [Desulfonatronum sp. SC1]